MIRFWAWIKLVRFLDPLQPASRSGNLTRTKLDRFSSSVRKQLGRGTWLGQRLLRSNSEPKQARDIDQAKREWLSGRQPHGGDHHDEEVDHHVGEVDHHDGKADDHHDGEVDHHDGKADDHHDEEVDHHDEEFDHHDEEVDHHDEEVDHHDEENDHHDGEVDHHVEQVDHHVEEVDHHDYEEVDHHDGEVDHHVEEVDHHDDEEVDHRGDCRWFVRLRDSVGVAGRSSGAGSGATFLKA